MPVDLYIGGAEHAVLHLLYARFWHKVLYDRGLVSTPEPFQKLVNQGMILGEMELTGYQGTDGSWTSAAWWPATTRAPRSSRLPASQSPPVRVAPEAGGKVGRELRAQGRSARPARQPGLQDVESRGNVVNPDKVVKEYGADSLRLYEMFMGPLEATKPWSMEGVNGVRGFLDRVWRMIVDERAEQLELNAAVRAVEPTAEQNRVLHKTIKA